MRAGDTGGAGIAPRVTAVSLESRGTPGRPKARAPIVSLEVRVRCEASRTP
jgi:hypothetical protein